MVSSRSRGNSQVDEKKNTEDDYSFESLEKARKIKDSNGPLTLTHMLEIL